MRALRALETWAEMSEHGFWHAGSWWGGPTGREVIDRMIVGTRAAYGFIWEPRTVQEFREEFRAEDFGEVAP